MLDSQQLESARQRLQRLPARVTIELDPGSDPDDRFAADLGEVLDSLAEVSAGNVTVTRRHSALYPGRPHFSVGNTHYLALPWGAELEPFLELLELQPQPDSGPESSPAAATVEVLVAPTCPNCAQVVRAAVQVAGPWPQLRLVVIDVQHHEDLGGAIKSVPAVIVDGTHTTVGPLDADGLRTILKGRDDPDHLPWALNSMIKAGRLAEAIKLVNSDKGFAAMARLMALGGLQERIGVLMVAEEALEANPHSLDGALPLLLPLLQAKDANLRGDTADLLGKIGAPGAREGLTRLLADPNPDVCEIAQEALEDLRCPS